MKKLVSLSLCIIFLLSLSPTIHAANNKMLSEDEIYAMSNYMNAGPQYIISGGWLYGEGHSNHANLSRYSSDLTSSSSLCDNVIPTYIHIEGGWIYFLAIDTSNNTGKTSIRRVRLSGADETILISDKNVPDAGEFDFLFFYGNSMYFTKSTWPEGALYRANIDGTEIEKILSKAVYYPYIVQDKLYYQDDSDGEKLHVCNLDGTEDSVFIDDIVYNYITDGVDFYYHSNQNGEDVVKMYSSDGTITSLGLNAYKIAYDGYNIYYTDVSDSYRLYSYNTITKEINLVSDDTYIDGINIVSQGVLTYFDCGDNGSKDASYMILFNGSNKTKIC